MGRLLAAAEVAAAAAAPAAAAAAAVRRCCLDRLLPLLPLMQAQAAPCRSRSRRSSPAPSAARRRRWPWRQPSPPLPPAAGPAAPAPPRTALLAARCWPPLEAAAAAQARPSRWHAGGGGNGGGTLRCELLRLLRKQFSLRWFGGSALNRRRAHKPAAHCERFSARARADSRDLQACGTTDDRLDGRMRWRQAALAAGGQWAGASRALACNRLD